jgi:cytochrome c biogenesis protein CcmG/thiol:disulfide interchange protein DsbE
VTVQPSSGLSNKADRRASLVLAVAFLGLLLGLLGLFIWGLTHGKINEVKSQMVGKPLPTFALPAAADNLPGLASTDFASTDFAGPTRKPRLLNVFASWCVPCRAEAPMLAQLAAQGVEIDGIAIRDHREDLAAFLNQYGNPYKRIGADNVSAVQLALGSSGVPESFVVDGRGVIRYQHIGDIRADQLPMILAKLKEAEQ